MSPRRRRGPALALAALAGLLAAALAVHGGCATAQERPPGGGGAAATLCFPEPRLGAPPAEVHTRVASLTERLAEPERAWIRALATHESGGRADAVSPTGCAGPLAIQRCAGCTPCCVSDARDRSLRPYDRCDHESRHGYLCGGGDPRFDAGFALDYARRRVGALRARLAPGDFSFRTALALSWNAGAGAVAGYPAGLGDAVSAVERLRFDEVEPYDAWPAEDRWNKLVEVYDYVLWFHALADYWGAPPETALLAPAAGARRCFARSGDGFVEAPPPAGVGTRLEVRRLRFGRYETELVELHPRDGPPRSR